MMKFRGRFMAHEYLTGGRSRGDWQLVFLMFVFFSNRFGCFSSILISLVGTALLFLLLRSCQGGFRRGEVISDQ